MEQIRIARPKSARRSARRATPSLESQESSLTERAWRALEEEIVTLRIPPGSVVSEAGLSARLGFGRTPVREALQRLASEGLVQILPRRGVIVTDIDVAAQLRLLEVRREIERLLARSAAQRSPPEVRNRFDSIAEVMEQAAERQDDMAFMRLDRAFNLLLLEAAANEFATAAMRIINGLARRFWYVHYKQVADMPLAARLHAAVARAVAAGDPDAAAVASDRLIDYIQDFSRKSIG
ncbi:GntR family transcriptional regulator [Enhydrobacter sp.]|uniref:GntR family transcriptional regulator n=1 Tax=Enhydrobacter sp. TaxID=1894999 RepID=UPI00262BECD9|nr:GntR family transcriptional regulator [Enhydrobacter sp.]WIM13338.1 MAG: Transcriptional regulator, GntR family [Enhydrobacter sp.]